MLFKRALPVLLLLASTSLQAQAQAQQSTISASDRTTPRVELSDDVKARISATITERRSLKETAGAAAIKSAQSRQTIQAARSRLNTIAAVTEYSDGYIDHIPGNDYSFPEDSHDFCRAYFNDTSNSPLVSPDYYLDMELADGETLVIDLGWEAVPGGFADFDVYVFDSQGYPVGDADPAALLGGTNENEFQTDNSNLVETATAVNNSGATQSVLVVVDRFRSSSPTITSAVTITVTGSDATDAFSVTEYIQPDQLTYVDSLGDNQVFPDTLILLSNQTMDFTTGLDTEGCAQSVVFSLVDSLGNNVVEPITSDGPVFSAFGANGSASIPAGSYTLSALPYSAQGGTGVTAPLIEGIITVIDSDPTWIELPEIGTIIPELETYEFTVMAISNITTDITYTIAVDTLDLETLGISFEDATFSWTPIESIGPDSFDITFTADNGINSVDSTITIVVAEVNVAPELATIEDQMGLPTQELTFTAMATDADTLAPEPFTFNTLTYSLEGAEAGMAIDPVTGVFTWTPAPADTGQFVVTVVVTDDGEPNLDDQQEVTIVVSPSDPAWIELPADGEVIPELTIFETTVLAMSNISPDITYSVAVDTLDLETLGITFENATFTWIPRESLGPDSFDITFTADNGVNSVDSTVTLVVAEVNIAPELAAIEGQTGDVSQELTFTAMATDADTLAPGPFTFNTLTYSLEDGEAGMAIDPSTGVFTWTPTAEGTFEVTVVVTDDGDPNLDDSQVVTIEIGPGDSIGIDDFTLINAITNEPVPGYDPIEQNAVIDLITISMANGVPIVSGLDSQVFNIRANVTDPAGTIESVDFELAVTPVLGGPPAIVDNDPGPPFSIYQEVDDNGSPNYNAETLVMGTYTLSGTPVGPTITEPITATVTFQVIGPRIVNFTLVNAVDDEDIDGVGEDADYNPIANDTTIFLNQVASGLNIRANTIDFATPVIESVAMVLTESGNQIQTITESFTPYSLFGDPTSVDIPPPYTEADYDEWISPAAGTYTLTATPFSEDTGQGFSLATTTITFTIDATGMGAPGSIASALGTPDETQLLPNYPNPFNPITTIRFGLEEATPVRITVYDMIGREVSVLVDGDLGSGFHEVSFDAGSLPSGMYLYRLETPTMVQVRPMTLLK